MKFVLSTLLCLSLMLISCTAIPQHRNINNHQPHPNANNIPLDEKPDPRRETSTWIPILKYNKEQSEDGSYKTEYETGNNIIHEETGFLKDFSENNPNGVLVQHGQYSYQSPEGETINVQYTADERGFRATGDHIPTPPAIPEEIQKGLDQIYAGIKQQQERLEQRAKSDPEFAKKLENVRLANQNGQYVGPLENP
uniref:Cuticle protein n=1 Tax=Musca domestica TaxID=7370 RepID=T1PCU4_MUSDO